MGIFGANALVRDPSKALVGESPSPGGPPPPAQARQFSPSPSGWENFNTYAASPGTVSGIIVRKNMRRKYLVVQNTGTVDCYVTGNREATTVDLLLRAGCSLEFLYADNMYLGELRAITASGTATLAIAEGE